jgi:RNA polymerase sigma-70 factor (ECF subfamily)
MSHSATISDADAVGQVLQGSLDSFATLVRRHTQSVHATAFAFTGAREDAEDITQEAFLRAYQTLDSLRDPARFAAWVVQIARNMAINLSRKRQRERSAPMAEQAAPVTPAAASSRAETREILRRHIESMEPQAREVLLMHYYAGHSTGDIAELLEITRHAAKKRLERARNTLGQELLGDLAPMVGPEQSVDERATSVMGAIPALAVGWKAGAPGAVVATGAVGSSILSYKAVMLGVGAVAAVAGGAFVLRPTPEPNPEPVVGATPVATAAVVEPSDESPTEEPVEAVSEDSSEASGAAGSEEETVRAVEPSTNIADVIAARDDARKALEERIAEVKISLGFNGEHITEIADFMGEYLDLTIVVDPRAVAAKGAVQMVAPPGVQRSAEGDGSDTAAPLPEEGTPPVFTKVVEAPGPKVNVDLKETPLKDVLDEILSPHKLSYHVEPGVLWVSTPELMKGEITLQGTPLADTESIDAAMGQRVTLKFENESLTAVLEFLSEFLEINIRLDQRVVTPEGALDEAPSTIVTDGIVPYVNLREVALSQVLRALLRPLNLSYSLEPGYVWVSSRALLEQDAKRAQLPLSASEHPPYLEQPISLAFANDTLSDVLLSVRQSTGVRVEVDAEVLRTVQRPDTEGWPNRIPALSAQELPLREALTIVTRMYNLSFTVRDNTVWISTLAKVTRGAFDSWELAALKPSEPMPEPEKLAPQRRRRSESTGPPELLRIVTAPDGTDRGQFRFRNGRTRLYAEGEAFEEFKVIAVNAEEGTIQLLDEKRNQELELQVSQ